MTPYIFQELPERGLVSMKVCKFQLHIEPREPILLPPYKGSTLRGGFGNAFKKVVCALRSKECSDCILKEKCVYSYVFETPPPDGTKVMRKYQSVPHPFIIEPPPERKMGYKPGDELTFGLTLIGKAIDYLPYFVYTFDELGNMGIGKGRGKYTLKTVFQKKTNLSSTENKTQIYSSETKKLTSFTSESLSISPFPLMGEGKGEGEPGTNAKSNDHSISITLNFLTPTRIYYNGRLTCDLEFHILIRQLLRRISMLSYFHCGIDPSQWDFKNLISRAKDITIKHQNLRWYDWQRYSARQEQRINMGGFVGDISYEGNMSPFLPLLKAGEILHVGKGTTFGLGRYETVDSQNDPQLRQYTVG